MHNLNPDQDPKLRIPLESSIDSQNVSKELALSTIELLVKCELLKCFLDEGEGEILNCVHLLKEAGFVCDSTDSQKLHAADALPFLEEARRILPKLPEIVKHLRALDFQDPNAVSLAHDTLLHPWLLEFHSIMLRFAPVHHSIISDMSFDQQRSPSEIMEELNMDEFEEDEYENGDYLDGSGFTGGREVPDYSEMQREDLKDHFMREIRSFERLIYNPVSSHVNVLDSLTFLDAYISVKVDSALSTRAPEVQPQHLNFILQSAYKEISEILARTSENLSREVIEDRPLAIDLIHVDSYNDEIAQRFSYFSPVPIVEARYNSEQGAVDYCFEIRGHELRDWLSEFVVKLRSQLELQAKLVNLLGGSLDFEFNTRNRGFFLKISFPLSNEECLPYQSDAVRGDEGDFLAENEDTVNDVVEFLYGDTVYNYEFNSEVLPTVATLAFQFEKTALIDPSHIGSLRSLIEFSAGYAAALPALAEAQLSGKLDQETQVRNNQNKASLRISESWQPVPSDFKASVEWLEQPSSWEPGYEKGKGEGNSPYNKSWHIGGSLELLSNETVRGKIIGLGQKVNLLYFSFEDSMAENLMRRQEYSELVCHMIENTMKALDILGSAEICKGLNLEFMTSLQFELGVASYFRVYDQADNLVATGTFSWDGEIQFRKHDAALAQDFQSKFFSIISEVSPRLDEYSCNNLLSLLEEEDIVMSQEVLLSLIGARRLYENSHAEHQDVDINLYERVENSKVLQESLEYSLREPQLFLKFMDNKYCVDSVSLVPRHVEEGIIYGHVLQYNEAIPVTHYGYARYLHETSPDSFEDNVEFTVRYDSEQDEGEGN